MALKQGAGRLIRRETDQGILVVADTRLRTKAYGKRLVAALPPMQRIGTQQAWLQALQQLVQGSAPVLHIPDGPSAEDGCAADVR